MILTILYPLYPVTKIALGTLYPAYKTWKALKRKNETNRRRWMKYWVSFSAFQTVEPVADFTLAYFLPFYIELKFIAIIWLVLGTRLIFDSIVDKELTKCEKSIDRWLNRTTKIRDETISLIWYEFTRCSFKILTTIMTGGISVLAESPKRSNQASPINSQDGDGDDEDTDMEVEQEDNDNDNDVKHKNIVCSNIVFSVID